MENNINVLTTVQSYVQTLAKGRSAGQRSLRVSGERGELRAVGQSVEEGGERRVAAAAAAPAPAAEHWRR